jgi:multiple sugar transport system permease protein
VIERNRLSLPFLAGATIMVAIPAVAAVVLSFTEYSGLQAPRFVGLDNFERLLGDAAFARSMWNSLIYIVMTVPFRLVITIALALALHERFRGAGAGRAAAYLPTVVPDVAYSLVWLWLLNPLYGPVAAILDGAGVTSPDWFTDPWGARSAVALMGLFQIGEGFVIALAARRALPSHLFDAARVDGASSWFTLSRVTLPLMTPVLLLLALRDVVLALQMNLVPALLLTDGGPRYATTYLPLFAYRQAFRYLRLGYASAISVTMFLFTALIVYVLYRSARRWRLSG